jgi:hypothetical protein
VERCQKSIDAGSSTKGLADSLPAVLPPTNDNDSAAVECYRIVLETRIGPELVYHDIELALYFHQANSYHFGSTFFPPTNAGTTRDRLRRKLLIRAITIPERQLSPDSTDLAAPVRQYQSAGPIPQTGHNLSMAVEYVQRANNCHLKTRTIGPTTEGFVEGYIIGTVLLPYRDFAQQVQGQW